MAGTKASVELILLLSLAMAFLAAAATPAAAPAASEDCSVIVTDLIDCLPFVMGTASKPPATCCSNLTAIIQNAPTCLCQLYNTTFTEPLGLNVTQAQKLPTACKVSTPDPSLCALIGIPVAAPMPVTSASPTPSAPGMAPTPSGTPSPSSSPVTPSSTPATPVPSSKNETTTSPSGSPSGAPIIVCSFSSLALLVAHLIVHL